MKAFRQTPKYIVSWLLLAFFTFACVWVTIRLVTFFLAVYHGTKEATFGHYLLAALYALGCMVGFAACGAWLLGLVRRRRSDF